MNISRKLLVRTAGAVIPAVPACFYVAARFSSPWDLLLRVVGIILAVCSLLILGVLALPLLKNLKNKKVQSWLRWLTLATRRGTRPNKVATNFLLDVLFGFCIVAILLILPWYSRTHTHGELLNWFITGAHLASSVVAFIVWFAYRRHRRKEHAREEHYQKALFYALDIVRKLQNASAKTQEELWLIVESNLQKIRKLFMIAHGSDQDDQYLSIWLYEPHLTEQVFRCKLIACSESKSHETREVQNSERVPFYGIVENQRMDGKSVGYGSLCARTLFENEASTDGYMVVDRCDSYFESEEFNQTYLPLISEGAREYFLGTSHLRVGLVCCDNAASQFFSSTHVFPAFAMHSQPLYFTEYDRSLLRIVATCLSEFLCSHSQLLSTDGKLLPFERPLLKETIGRDANQLEYRLTNGSYPSPPGQRGRERKPCIIPLMVEWHSKLESASGYIPQAWPIISHGGKQIDVEVTHKAPINKPNARDFLEQSNRHQLHIFIDLSWANQSLRSMISSDSIDKIFLKVERETLDSPYFRQLIEEVRKEKLVIVLRVPTADFNQAQKQASFLKSFRVSLCYDGIESGQHLRLALEHKVDSVKFRVELARAAIHDPNYLERLRDLAQTAVRENLVSIIQGADEVLMQKLNGLLGDTRGLVKYEGENLSPSSWARIN